MTRGEKLAEALITLNDNEVIVFRESDSIISKKTYLTNLPSADPQSTMESFRASFAKIIDAERANASSEINQRYDAVLKRSNEYIDRAKKAARVSYSGQDLAEAITNAIEDAALCRSTD